MASQAPPGIPALFTQPPPIRDPLVTETIDLQDATLAKCLPFLQGVQDSQKGPFNACGVPALQRGDHLFYLYDALEDYPPSFVLLDSSRPWMAYWGLAGLSLMGEDPTQFRERYGIPILSYARVLCFVVLSFVRNRRDRLLPIEFCALSFLSRDTGDEGVVPGSLGTSPA